MLTHNLGYPRIGSQRELKKARRQSPFAQRIGGQQARLQLPLFPTTTIGSFPQTEDIRQLRARWKKGELLDGFAFTGYGWVQSYGRRGVKPPVLYGDIHRPQDITVAWTTYAQSLTTKPMKGMLTGRVTILQWSFVRGDQPRALTALQLALEAAGISIIQINEPAIWEGLPRASHRARRKPVGEPRLRFQNPQMARNRITTPHQPKADGVEAVRPFEFSSKKR